MDFILGSDAALAALAFLGGYFSYRVRKVFRRDIMESVTIFTIAAFLLIGLTSFLDAALRVAGINWDVFLFRTALIISSGLIVAGLAVFLRWERSSRDGETGNN